MFYLQYWMHHYHVYLTSDANQNMVHGIMIRAAVLENRSSGFPTGSDTNWAVQSQKKARRWKFWI